MHDYMYATNIDRAVSLFELKEFNKLFNSIMICYHTNFLKIKIINNTHAIIVHWNVRQGGVSQLLCSYWCHNSIIIVVV